MKLTSTLAKVLLTFGTQFEISKFIINGMDTWVLLTGKNPDYTMESYNVTWSLILVHDHVDELTTMYPNVEPVGMDDDVITQNPTIQDFINNYTTE
jgi:hypothetical protein